MRKLLGTIALVLASLWGPTPSHATVVIDQVSTPPPSPWGFGLVGVLNPIVFGSDERLVAIQTITAGRQGLLDHIDIPLATLSDPDPGNLLLSIIDGDYGAGARSVVGQVSLPIGNLPIWSNYLPFSFDTRGLGYTVTSGQKFSLLFDTDPNATGVVFFSAGNADMDPVTGQYITSSHYAGGQLIAESDGSPLEGYDLDMAFTTFVDTAAGSVPEPATWAMMILGFGMIGGVARRRNRTAAMSVAALN